MTPKKRLFELKKELMAVKKKMNKLNNLRLHYPTQYFPPVDEYAFPAYIDSYTVITGYGKMYIINCLTNEFPDIKFKNILYIKKTKCNYFNKRMKNGSFKRIDPNWVAFDSYTGKMMTSWNPEYDEVIAKKFPYTETIGDYED